MDRFQEAQTQQSQHEALRNWIKSEADNRACIYKSFLERCVNATPEEQIGLQQKVEFLEGTIRQLNIAAKALDYTEHRSDSVVNPEEANKLTPHWIDKFNELARARNEPWRAELLSRALAQETAFPGSVNISTLWLIGSMDESLFTCFSELLDICTWDDGDGIPFVPDSMSVHLRQPLDHDKKRTVGGLTFSLTEISVISAINASRSYDADEKAVVHYGQRSYEIEFKREVRIPGIIFTSLGKSLARFYTPIPCELGEAIFDEWINSIAPFEADVRPVKMPSEPIKL